MQVNVAGAQVAMSDSTRIFGVTIDTNLTFDDHVKSVCKTHTIIYEHNAISDRC